MARKVASVIHHCYVSFGQLYPEPKQESNPPCSFLQREIRDTNSGAPFHILSLSLLFIPDYLKYGTQQQFNPNNGPPATTAATLATERKLRHNKSSLHRRRWENRGNVRPFRISNRKVIVSRQTRKLIVSVMLEFRKHFKTHLPQIEFACHAALMRDAKSVCRCTFWKICH